MNLLVDNCPICGNIYHKNPKNMCVNCVKKIDLEYDKCLKYLRENKQSNITDLNEATEVSIKLIRQFILEGRISTEKFKSLRLKCEICGVQVKNVKMCEQCRHRLSRQLEQSGKTINIEKDSKGGFHSLR
jgi:hypothetical protein